jgi:intracellular sulfur oxidation DsrE/DsrF family protein
MGERDLLLRPGDVLVIGGLVGKFRGVERALDNIADVLNDPDRDRVRVLLVPDVEQVRVLRREGEGEPVQVRVEEGAADPPR